MTGVGSEAADRDLSESDRFRAFSRGLVSAMPIVLDVVSKPFAEIR